MKLAVIFPGQGSQSVGMLTGLAAKEPLVQETFTEASALLGYDLWQLVSNGPAEKLNQTEYTQPALLTAGVAAWRVWQRHDGPSPAYMAGHSLGEYTALVCAEALTFADAVRLVAERGRAMQAAVPAGQGAMAAVIGATDENVSKLCETAALGDVLTPANYNSPGQVVIAGSAPAVQRAIEQAKEFGARKVVPLPVSVPSHCALMTSAAQYMAGRLAEVNIRTPQIPVLQNVDAEMHREPDAIRTALTRQIELPVRWTQTIEKMNSYGVDRWLECGPGQVLTGLVKRIVKNAACAPVNDPESLGQQLQEMKVTE